MKTYAGFRRAWEPSRDGDRHDAIDEFVETRLDRYADDRDFPGLDATSRLSPLIASGEISVADCTAAALAAPPTKGRQKWLDELCWHDWFERQRERFDAAGAYCRRWLPEWGTDAYPEPMLDLSAEAAEAKERFKAASR